MLFSLAILAGGRSSRMGANKCLVPVAGRPLVERVLRAIAPHAAEAFLIADDPLPYKYLAVPIYPDDAVGLGPLGGLAAALRHATQARVLLAACDMPFVRWELAAYLLALAEEAEVVVPVVRGEVEPLFAVYARACQERVLAAIGQGERRMISFFPKVKTRYVREEELVALDPGGLTFFNLNTPDDLTQAEKLAQGALCDEHPKQ